MPVVIWLVASALWADGLMGYQSFEEMLPSAGKTSRRHNPAHYNSKLNSREMSRKFVDWNELSQDWFYHRISAYIYGQCVSVGKPDQKRPCGRRICR